MVSQLIVQIFLLIIIGGGISQIIIFKKQNKSNLWLGYVVTAIGVVASILNWLPNINK